MCVQLWISGPTNKKGRKNSYCVVKCVITCVINEQCNRCVSTFLTVVEVLRDNRKKPSLLMRNIDISNLCEQRSLYFPLLNSSVPHFTYLNFSQPIPSSLLIWLPVGKRKKHTLTLSKVALPRFEIHGGDAFRKKMRRRQFSLPWKDLWS